MTAVTTSASKNDFEIVSRKALAAGGSKRLSEKV